MKKILFFLLVMFSPVALAMQTMQAPAVETMQNSLGDSAFFPIEAEKAHEQGDHVKGTIPTREELAQGYIPTEADFIAGYVPDYADISEPGFFQYTSESADEDLMFIAKKTNADGRIITIVFDTDQKYRYWDKDAGVEPEHPTEPKPATEGKYSLNRAFGYVAQNKFAFGALFCGSILAFVISKYINKSKKVSA